MRYVSDVSHSDYKIAVLENMLNRLSVQTPQASQTSIVSCSHNQALNHTLSSCPHLPHQLSTGQKQVNVTYKRPRMTHSLITIIQGSEITLTFSRVVDQMFPNSQAGVFSGNNSQHISHSFNSYQRFGFSGVPNAPRLPLPIAHI